MHASRTSTQIHHLCTIPSGLHPDSSFLFRKTCLIGTLRSAPGFIVSIPQDLSYRMPLRSTPGFIVSIPQDLSYRRKSQGLLEKRISIRGRCQCRLDGGNFSGRCPLGKFITIITRCCVNNIVDVVLRSDHENP